VRPCHVYVEPEWLGRLAPMSKIEDSLLGLLDVRKPNSRLSCQRRATTWTD
jgi:2Fe-2S ferredoxin